ncbi:hypothetical protein [Photorhabdus bodei]|uniref:Uncharacterized protein n=1 Tax=Photorhabdus bodei TaxID=2029681 RepID=A0A329XAV8_9GAMM|nr:hypothetical protein [Photorhabdus bodei]NDL01042.1 hypothetical protein [Photorhabdus bodei]NDL05291.1 hypothetical protein [Photorhabdus bodei]NDL09545.1 hypothetical protein [Photorhabdus bodei]RAX13746.1 hypothetical protein CKY02_04630 [Photorhabdus bodei]
MDKIRTVAETLAILHQNHHPFSGAQGSGGAPGGEGPRITVVCDNVDGQVELWSAGSDGGMGGMVVVAVMVVVVEMGVT